MNGKEAVWQYNNFLINGTPAASIRKNQYCCGLFEIGGIATQYMEDIFSTFSKFRQQKIGNHVVEVILPIEDKVNGEENEYICNIVKGIPHILAAGFVPYGKEWHNPNTDHTLQAYRYFPK